MQIDQKQSTQPQNNDTSKSDLAGQDQSKKKAAEDQAEEFTKELGKKKAGKKDKLLFKGQSLSDLLAERSKHARDKQLDDEKIFKANEDSGRGLQDHPFDMSFAQIKESQLKGDFQIKEIHQPKSVKEVEAALLKMADKIHVSAKDAVDGSEMRISIKDNILPATEVRIHRHGGELVVTLNTTSAETHNLLAQHQASLQKHLDDRFSNENVQVSFNMAGENNDENEDGSRNQYVEDDSNDDDKKNNRTV